MTVETAAANLLARPEVARRLSHHRHGLLSVEALEPSGASRVPTPPTTVRLTVFDYVTNRSLRIEGDIQGLLPIEIIESHDQPPPNDEEFRRAVEILKTHRTLGPRIKRGQLSTYKPMPPLVEEAGVTLPSERTLAVGLWPASAPDRESGNSRHEIVGVNMIRRTIERYEEGAPPHARAGPNPCGPQEAGQPSVSRGTVGQARVTVRQGDQVIWSFHVVRPAGSSGTEGSGVELRYVEYRGRRVLSRAHVPIVNVIYDDDVCGPFRDWMWEEGTLEATGLDIGPGFRECEEPPRTITDAGTDVGNFAGVAIHVVDDEVRLTSELQAGWYRYVHEWRLHTDGTILPRFQFAAVLNSCTCQSHVHHAYWRFDFDIDGAPDDVAREDAGLGAGWQAILTESKSLRSPEGGSRWQVSDDATGRGYSVLPGPHDGFADDWGAGDVWVLRQHDHEIDDGSGYTTDPDLAKANLDRFLTGESVDGQNIVMWYGGHVVHGETTPGMIGPTLVPVQW